jgi:hypothetical protein
VESGHKVSIPPLPPATKDTPASAFVSPHLKRQPLPEEEARALIENEKLPANRIVVADDLRGAHPLVHETKKRMERKFGNPFNRVYPRWVPDERERQIININVSQGALYRALRIMDALFKAIETHGGEIKIRDRKTFCLMSEAEVQFSLWEKVTRSERELSEKERRESYVSDRWIFTPTGQLTFRIDECYVGRNSWRDKTSKRLEEQLNDVMIGLITASRIIRERDLEWERKRQLELEEQQRRAELARLQQIEQGRRGQLDKLVDAWIRSLNIRQFLAHYENTLSKQGSTASENLEARWLSWARSYADELDPMTGDHLGKSLLATFPFQDKIS